MAGVKHFIPHNILDGVFMGYVNAMRLPGLGGKLNGKLVQHRSELSDAVEDSNTARSLISGEFTKREPNEKGELVPVKVPKRDPATNEIVYQKDPDGNKVYEMVKGELVPVPQYDDNATALTDVPAFLREYNALMAEDIIIEVQPLTEAELLIIQSKGTAEHANALRPLSEGSKYLKPKEEREKITLARQSQSPTIARLLKQKEAREAAEKEQREKEAAATDRGGLDGGAVVDDVELSKADLEGTIEPEPSEQPAAAEQPQDGSAAPTTA